MLDEQYVTARKKNDSVKLFTDGAFIKFTCKYNLLVIHSSSLRSIDMHRK